MIDFAHFLPSPGVRDQDGQNQELFTSKEIYPNFVIAVMLTIYAVLQETVDT